MNLYLNVFRKLRGVRSGETFDVLTPAIRNGLTLDQ